MSKIILHTLINAPIETVFNNCRNIDLHIKSANQTNEKAIAGKTSGLIEKGETVTWKGKHFGFYMTHQSIISEMENPYNFVDEQLKGMFKIFKHSHFFKTVNNTTVMIDCINYEVSFGILGKIFDQLVLKKHLTQFLEQRNNFIKEVSVSQH